MPVLQQIWLYEIIGGKLPMCQNTTMWVNEAWIKRYSVLCSKTYNTLHSCHNFPVGSRQAARVARICETNILLCIQGMAAREIYPGFIYCIFFFGGMYFHSNGGFAKPLLRIGHGWVTVFHRLICMWLLIHARTWLLVLLISLSGCVLETESCMIWPNHPDTSMG